MSAASQSARGTGAAHGSAQHVNVAARAAEELRPGASLPRDGLRRIRSNLLFTQGKEVIIEHGEREYRLRVTASGKLILTA